MFKHKCIKLFRGKYTKRSEVWCNRPITILHLEKQGKEPRYLQCYMTVTVCDLDFV